MKKKPFFFNVFCVAFFTVGGAGIGKASAQVQEPDYTSKAPRFVFPSTLDEQEAALKSNPLLARFNEA